MAQQASNSDTASNIQVGGAYIEGSVQTGGGNFIGRDQITITVASATEAADLYARLASAEALAFTPKAFEPATILIPAGVFLMGSAPAPTIPSYETPQSRIFLADYRIGKTPITQRQYAEFVRQTGHSIRPEAGWYGQVPADAQLDEFITGVTWFDAIAYCEWLTQQSGRHYRLPNEAEWEKAAVQAETNGFVWGAVREWTCTLWGEKSQAPAVQFAYPWVADERNVITAGAHLRRVFRGGLPEDTNQLRCQARSSYMPDKPGPPGKRHGFRIVLCE